VDFHALRHTFVSRLASSGVHPKTAQRLARHSTITLTIDPYTHSEKGAELDVLAALPSLSVSAHAWRELARDRDLMRLLETWPRLPEAVRKALVAAADAASHG